jgi:hypothetical protein
MCAQRLSICAVGCGSRRPRDVQLRIAELSERVYQVSRFSGYEK